MASDQRLEVSGKPLSKLILDFLNGWQCLLDYLHLVRCNF